MGSEVVGLTVKAYYLELTTLWSSDKPCATLAPSYLVLFYYIRVSCKLQAIKVILSEKEQCRESG
jgi:hypothetical protein